MKPRLPDSYREIEYKTVPQLDGSFRSVPVRHTTDAENTALLETAHDALIAAGMFDIGLECEDYTITVRGWVRDRARADAVLSVIRRALPDADIVDVLHLGPP